MIGPPVAMPWMRLAPFVGLWLTPWLFQSGFVGSSSGFVGSSKWLHRADTRTPSPFGRNPRYAPMRQVNLLTLPQPLTDQGALCRRAFPSHSLPRWDHQEVTID